MIITAMDLIRKLQFKTFDLFLLILVVSLVLTDQSQFWAYVHGKSYLIQGNLHADSVDVTSINWENWINAVKTSLGLFCFLKLVLRRRSCYTAMAAEWIFVVFGFTFLTKLLRHTFGWIYPLTNSAKLNGFESLEITDWSAVIVQTIVAASILLIASWINFKQNRSIWGSFFMISIFCLILFFLLINCAWFKLNSFPLTIAFLLSWLLKLIAIMAFIGDWIQKKRRSRCHYFALLFYLLFGLPTLIDLLARAHYF